MYKKNNVFCNVVVIVLDSCFLSGWDVYCLMRTKPISSCWKALVSLCRPVPVQRLYSLWLSCQVQQEQEPFSVTNSSVVQLFTLFCLQLWFMTCFFFFSLFVVTVMCFLFVAAHIKAGGAFRFPLLHSQSFRWGEKVLEAEVGKLHGLKAFKDIKVSDWKCSRWVVPKPCSRNGLSLGALLGFCLFLLCLTRRKSLSLKVTTGFPASRTHS